METREESCGVLSQTFKNDILLICDNPDRDFVKQLYYALLDKNYTVSVKNIAQRDHVIEAVNVSCQVYLIMSDSFRENSTFETELANIVDKMIAQDRKDLVLVRLDDIPVPDCLAYLHPIEAWRERNVSCAVDKALQSIVTSMNKQTPNTRSGVFFVYKTISPDKEWVYNTVEKLAEASPNIKCYYHEKHFHPGLKIIENIVHFMRKSEKVVVVLTPAFLESNWVEFETQLAKQINIEKPHCLCVIPVLLKPCDIPEFLQTTTYLDATTEGWWPRLLKSLEQNNKDLYACSHVAEHRTFCKFFSFSGRVNTDENEPWLIDICFSLEGNIIVIDAKNKKLKTFSCFGESNGKLLQELNFKTRPMFLTLFDNDEIYITFPDDEFIMIIKEGQQEQKLPVPHQCAGIVKLDEEHIALCCRSQQEILILTRNGTVLHHIKPLVGSNEIEEESDLTTIITSLQNQGNDEHMKEKGNKQEHDVDSLTVNLEKSSLAKDTDAGDDVHDSDEEIDTMSTEANKNVGKKDYHFLKQAIKEAEKANTRLVMPGFIATTTFDNGLRVLYVTDYKTKRATVIYLGQNGVFYHRSTSPLQDPRGVLVYQNEVLIAAGSIRVYDLHLKSVKRKITIDASFPRSLVLNCHGELLAITHKDDGDDHISVFNIS